MDFFGTIMGPFNWLVSAVMVGIHDVLSSMGMPAASGWTWTLSIIGLVLIIRAVLIPVFLRQVSAQRRMRLLQPDLKRLQDKYKGKTDQLSRQAMAQEQMALYKEHGTNPLSACLPMLIQVPFFFALFQVLSGIPAAAKETRGIGAMTHEQAVQFDESSIFGARCQRPCCTAAVATPWRSQF
ncbi:membrane protein insertase YidC [Arthrobacter sp. Hiyo4]|nr:membrane protein insertase YidC [Arthrobacter sp. Hiyo4]